MTPFESRDSYLSNGVKIFVLYCRKFSSIFDIRKCTFGSAIDNAPSGLSRVHADAVQIFLFTLRIFRRAIDVGRESAKEFFGGDRILDNFSNIFDIGEYFRFILELSWIRRKARTWPGKGNFISAFLSRF